jgi:predicted RNase H-like HicB family nuclease
MTAKFIVVIENGEKNYSAYSPDFLGCEATGNSAEATL